MAKLNYAMVCDKAFNEAPGQNGLGKLNISGIFEIVYYKDLGFPLMLPQFSVLYNFIFGDLSDHKILVRIEDSDGNFIAETQEVVLRQTDIDSSVNFVANFNGIIRNDAKDIVIKYKLDNTDYIVNSKIRLVKII